MEFQIVPPNALKMSRWRKPLPFYRISQPLSGGFPMPFIRGSILRIFPLLALIVVALSAPAQSGNAGAVRGTVTDPSGAVIPNAVVHLTNHCLLYTSPSPTRR